MSKKSVKIFGGSQQVPSRFPAGSQQVPSRFPAGSQQVFFSHLGKKGFKGLDRDR